MRFRDANTYAHAIIPPEQSKGGVRNSIMDRGKNRCPSFPQSVTLFSSHTIKARGLKFGMHNSYMNNSKVNKPYFWYFA